MRLAIGRGGGVAVWRRAPAGAQELWPGTTYDPAIPTIKSVLGHDFGEEISAPEEIAIYLKALAAAAPDRTRLVEYARTWEGRPAARAGHRLARPHQPARRRSRPTSSAWPTRARCRAPTSRGCSASCPS